MEYFDLVDEHDKIIGTTTQQKSHQDGGIHRVAAIYVFDNKDRLYVQEHIKGGGKYDHSVGGHVSQGETYDEAAKREGLEELGIIDPLEKVSVFYSDETFGDSNIRHYFGLYECHPSEDWHFKPNDEVKTIIPMTITDIIDLMNVEPKRFTGGFRNTMKEYIRVKQLSFVLNDNVFKK